MYTRGSEKNFSPSRLAPSNAFSSPVSRRPPRTRQVRLIGPLDVQGIPIELAVDRDAGDPHLRERPAGAGGDFAPVCNENLAEHRSGSLAGAERPNDPPIGGWNGRSRAGG